MQKRAMSTNNRLGTGISFRPGFIRGTSRTSYLARYGVPDWRQSNELLPMGDAHLSEISNCGSSWKALNEGVLESYLQEI